MQDACWHQSLRHLADLWSAFFERLVYRIVELLSSSNIEKRRQSSFVDGGTIYKWCQHSSDIVLLLVTDLSVKSLLIHLSIFIYLFIRIAYVWFDWFLLTIRQSSSIRYRLKIQFVVLVVTVKKILFCFWRKSAIIWKSGSWRIMIKWKCLLLIGMINNLYKPIMYHCILCIELYIDTIYMQHSIEHGNVSLYQASMICMTEKLGEITHILYITAIE